MFYLFCSHGDTSVTKSARSPSQPMSVKASAGTSKAKRRCLCTAERWPGRDCRINSGSVCAVLSLPVRREPLGASSDPAGSESLPALLQHCITKAKGVAANNNNNATSARRTGWCRWPGQAPNPHILHILCINTTTLLATLCSYK